MSHSDTSTSLPPDAVSIAEIEGAINVWRNRSPAPTGPTNCSFSAPRPAFSPTSTAS